MGFHEALRKHNSKTVADLYKTNISSRLNVQKTFKADRKFLQRLLNAVTSGRTIQMGDILKHELSPIPPSLAQPSGDMNTTIKAELIAVLTNGVDIPYEVPDADTKTCVLIDGHALIQSLGKPNGCQTFGDYADVFVQNVTRDFREHTSRVDVVFDRYIGKSSNKAVTRSKRVSKKNIGKLIDDQNVPLPLVWSNFISLDENKADLARSLSYVVMKKGMALQQSYELVTEGGFSDATDARSTRRDNVMLLGNHEEADTRLILHLGEALDEGYERALVSRDTDVLLLLVHFTPTKPVEVWMISGTAKNRKCYPVREASQRLAQSLETNLLSFHALTGCDTTSVWINEEGCLKAVWTRQPPIPDACLELVKCGCKSKCRTVRCSCFRKDIKCSYACSRDAIECSNPAGL